MPLGDLIAIGGATAGNSGSKRGGASDLTSGLISISDARDNADADMSDFDVGDLLGDDSGKSKARAKDKSDDKKKKKSKDKSKSASSSSKKKSKSKSKKSAFGDDDDFGDDGGGAADDWNSSAKNWDSAAELEMAAAAAARRKNGSGKSGGGLDDEFAQMLGLDNGGGADFGSAESPPLSPEPSGWNRDNEKVDKFANDDIFGIPSYTPTVRGSKKSEQPDTIDVHESAKGSGGVSASFFQDDNKDDMNATSLSSMLGPTTERRGGTRGGSRRQPGGAESDPFGLGASTATSSSTFESLFGGSSSRRSAFDDPFAKPTRDPPDDYESRRKDPIEEKKLDQARDEAPPARDAVPVTQRLSAKDDLLANLFPVEPRSSTRSGRRQQELPLSKQEEVVDEDYGKKSKVEVTPEPTPAILPVAVDPAKQQNDLLADLFASQPSSKTAAYDKRKEQEEELKLKPQVVEVKSVTPPKQKSPPPEKEESLVHSAVPSGKNTNADLASARDSLLMDLLGDLSPPKPVSSRRRSPSTSNSNNSSPSKEVIKVEDPFKSSLPPSPVQLQSLATVPEVPTETTTTSERPTTPPSPGRLRSLTVDKGALAIRESDFEQSKDSLLEEILPSSLSASARSSPRRRNSYSQSFDVEDSIVVDAVDEQLHETVKEQKPQVPAEPPAPDPPAPVAPVVKLSPPLQEEVKITKQDVQELSSKPEPAQRQTGKTNDSHEVKAVFAPVCNCVEREANLTAAFEIERAAHLQKFKEFTQQLETQAASSAQLTQQLTRQLEEREVSASQLSQQLETRAAANAQLTQQLAATERDKLQADQLAATSKDDAASYQHRAELLESELRGLREELSRSKRAVQDAELTLARKTAEHDEVDQLERHREKRALEALSAQMQRALARLTVSHQVQEEGAGYDNSAARVAAEDEARLRVIASLEGSSKRAAQHAEQERLKLAELLRELEAGARNARQGTLEDKERLRQEQQRLDALSAHLQAQAAALRDQEAAHAAYMGQQLAEARGDARVYEARLATRRTQLERDERALYEARTEFAAFREQTALEIDREHEALRASRLALEDAWRELRADREDLEAELASHEDEFQALESMRYEVQQAEARLAERTQEVVALAEKLDAGTRELLEREQLVAQQATVVQDTDTSFSNRERALERVKNELEAREQRVHVQIRQLDTARGRLTQQRREQQQLMAAARRQYSPAQQPAKVAVDNNKPWRQSEFTSAGHRSSTISSNNFNHQPPVVDKLKTQPWGTGLHLEEDPSGLSPALRKQVEANWQRRGHRRQSSTLTFDLGDLDATSAYPPTWFTKTKDADYMNRSSNVGSSAKTSSSSAQQKFSAYPRKSPDPFQSPLQQQSKSTPSATSLRTAHARVHGLGSHQAPPPPPSLTGTTGTFQPTLRVNL
ncbi:hypothetical protein PHYPSEUDO_001906 [Phytophthora pseudosyringae]|uniref:Uncharacterized protein n=1 Tax=Phytophthora pseudosyringae TaxID=221518 RepID=A0A8T1WJT4_9STRA|nr:hypothetical protein PHYPSEUDO_001906 [Phytophthora pseudosyringae]